MPRRARLVVPDVPHHITQRGLRRNDIFFCDDDRRRYLAFLIEACRTQQVRSLAWCLMTNHVHLILVPPTADALRATLASSHIRFASYLARAHGSTGPVFQGRFGSVPMSDAHWVAAVRYVETNPYRPAFAAALKIGPGPAPARISRASPTV